MKTLIFLYPLTQHQLETDELKIGLQQVTVSECYGMGRIYTAQDLVDKDLDKFIPTEIELLLLIFFLYFVRLVFC